MLICGYIGRHATVSSAETSLSPLLVNVLGLYDVSVALAEFYEHYNHA